MFSKARIDMPSDGIFGVAMTLLIPDVRLPDDFHPNNGTEVVQGLIGQFDPEAALIHDQR